MFPMFCHCDVENDVELLLAGESVRIAVLLRTFFHSSWCAFSFQKDIVIVIYMCNITTVNHHRYVTDFCCLQGQPGPTGEPGTPVSKSIFNCHFFLVFANILKELNIQNVNSSFLTTAVTM